MVCKCGSDQCTCVDRCLCNSCICLCWPCVDLRRNIVCKCGHREDCVRFRFPYLMPMPDLSFLNNPLQTAGTSGEDKPDEPGKPESKNLTAEEKKKPYSQPMIFQMDDIDSPADESKSPEDQVAPHFISIRSQPNPCIVASQHGESVTEQAQGASLDTCSKCNESSPSGLSDDALPSFRVPTAEFPKPQLATSAPSSSSVSSPRVQTLPVRSASSLPELYETTSASNLESLITHNVHDVEVASDKSSSIEIIPEDLGTQFSLKGKFADLSISTLPPISFSVERSSEACASITTSEEQCTEMSLQQQSATVSISKNQFEAECVSDSCSSDETYTETTSIDDQESSHEDSL